ncbi:Bifunctional protein GlmU [Roseivivax sp. THAF40]|uniref:nucleotidyltransferase family protein n=1 Tax=unclassified Roseivivax TaxID=2639302 RepID=UPI001268DA67|nr:MULTISPECIES: nucleotidyltransferase family protein [unclassified Roseivivax]QFS84652.1 Bifunctional protein GlmU [Roseivivax sp. THAF197b]QFT48479.1 Bifunctional protein GlmU [Roseivivax sp. THAF40]
MPDAVMIFAAGFGTRMGALTANRPKPLIEVAGRSLLDRTLSLAAHVPRRVVNAHYLGHMIADHLAGQDVTVVQEETILDTGGGLKNAASVLGAGPVFTMNADAVFAGPNPLRALEAAWQPDRMDALLLCVPLPRAIGRNGGGDFAIGEDGRLSRGGAHVYTGVQIVKTDGLSDIHEEAFSLNMLWDRMATEGRLYGFEYPGRWADVGHPDGISRAEEMLAT